MPMSRFVSSLALFVAYVSAQSTDLSQYVLTTVSCLALMLLGHADFLDWRDQWWQHVSGCIIAICHGKAGS
jgi:hypothetical protein